MNQAFWKTYKSKVLQTLSGDSEEDLAEEVGTIQACWVGHGKGSRSERYKEGKGAGSERERGTFCQKQSAHSGTTDGMVQCQKVWSFKKTEKEEKTWRALEERSLSPEFSKVATWKRSF